MRGDVSDPASLTAALSGVDAAYYLVHSLDDDDFERKDAEAARAFCAAAEQAGLERIIYLGGLGREGQDLSTHLRSRREVERLLAEGSVPVTVLRAAIVIGHGGISWEITRQLVAHLPAMVVPQWATTKTQPIALRDMIRYLVGRARAGGRPRPGVRGRRAGGADLRRDDAAGRPDPSPSAAAHAQGAAAHPAAVLALAVRWSPTWTPPPPATWSTR